tara:strand:- start:1560 stop:1793 length:234 start_codon:yes stop_codon:yes gene_type:complete
MTNLLINIILLLAGAYIFYTIYDTQIKNRREPLQVLYPEKYSENIDYILDENTEYDVIPFDAGIRVNHFLTCTNQMV